MVNTSGKGKRPYKRKLQNVKRPLSAYNFFFRSERGRILAACEGITVNKQTTKTGKRAHRKSHGAINFSDMGKRIAAAWKMLDEEGRAPYVAEATQDLKRYQEAKEKAEQQVSNQNPPVNNIIGNLDKVRRSNRITHLQADVGEQIEQTTDEAPKPNSTRINQLPPPSTTTITQDFAYKCEVCWTALFATYDECLKHERQCIKTSATRKVA